MNNFRNAFKAFRELSKGEYISYKTTTGYLFDCGQYALEVSPSQGLAELVKYEGCQASTVMAGYIENFRKWN